MAILVVAATEMEIAPFISQGFPYLITGVGVPACMYQLQHTLQQAAYDCVIQAGIAGSFTPAIALGETVLIKRDVFADLGIFENGQLHSLFETGFVHKNVPPYSNGWLANSSDVLNRFSLPKYDAVTVNTVTEQQAVLQEYKRLYNPSVESMEGAAFHYICLMQHIPFLQLRAVSNMVGERDKSKWNIAAAVHNLNNHLHNIVAVLNQHQ